MNQWKRKKKSKKARRDKESGDSSRKRKTDKTAEKKYVPAPTDNNGRVLFPISLGVLTVESLGKIIYDQPNWHSEAYIWPNGYKSRRVYASMKDPERKVNYECEIILGPGGTSPAFQITPEDDPDQPIIGSSATAVWKTVLERVNALKTEQSGKRMFAAISGPEYFGFSQPTVAKLIQDLPNADKCERYKMKQFEIKEKAQRIDLTEFKEDALPLKPKKDKKKKETKSIMPALEVVRVETHPPVTNTITSSENPLVLSLKEEKM